MSAAGAKLAAVGVASLVAFTPGGRAAAADALQAARAHMPSTSSASSSTRSTTSSAAGVRAAAFAGRQLGKPYVWAAQGPDAYDCSGLVIRSWQAAGAHWPDSTANGLGHHFPRVRLSQARPGDLVLWDWGRGSRVAGYDHVGIVTTGGRFVEAPQPGVAVRIRTLAGTRPSAVVRPGLRW